MTILPLAIRERIDGDSRGHDQFGLWLVDWLDRFWAQPDKSELLTNTVAYVFDREREIVRIEDIISLFDSHELPFAELRDYLLRRYP